MFSSLALKIWRGFSRSAINIFYRNYEVAGFDSIPTARAVIFCANHVNALVDPVLVQAASSKIMRPLARSGLFDKWWLKPILKIIGAVPIFRSQDTDTSQNENTFRCVYELLEQGEWIIIFPEGQSHSKSSIQTLKTGASRMALGTIQRGRTEPLLIPVGLTFTNKGHFRGDVLVYFGSPIDLAAPPGTNPESHVRLVTRRLTEGLRAVTINTDNWQDLELVARIERFFAFRHGKFHRRNLLQRFQALKRIISRHQLLRQRQPELIDRITHDLERFEKMCKNLGVKDYHLTVAYRPFLVIWYGLKILAALFIGLPLIAWTLINSIIPFFLTRQASQKIATGRDQFDTTKILLGFSLFFLFWGLQTLLVHQYLGLKAMMLYLISLVVGSIFVLRKQRDIVSMRENIHVFFLFVRNRGLKEHLIAQRSSLERELAKLVKIAHRHMHRHSSTDT